MSSREDRRLRLELLSLRAEMQRMELHQHVQEVKASVQWGQLLVAGVQKLVRSRNWAQGSALARHFVDRYPMLAMAGSVGFGLFRKPILKAGLRLALVGAVSGGLWWLFARGQLAQAAARSVNPPDSASPAGQTVPQLGQ